MSDILIFAGTTEGRQLAQILSENHIPADLCVATEYGSAVLPPLPGIYVHEGRLEVTGMKSLYEQCHTKIIVDATHPFATLVTKTIQDSIRDLPLRYLRLGRDGGHYRGENAIRFYDDLSDCIRHLKTTTGGILLTTGSKELPAFCRCKELKDRLVVRVLPGMESLKICLEQGLDRRQIIAIQGPFSLEMNKAMLLQYNCCHLVTKESGSVGGVDTKVLAARELGITLHMIRRPDPCATPSGELDMEEVLQALEDHLQKKLQKPSMTVILGGAGCGDEESMTIEVKRAIEEADVIYGAPRLIEKISKRARTFPYYLWKDILPSLERLQQTAPGQKVLILFSGDSGFYSGCEKLYRALLEHKEKLSCQVHVLPGISSLQLFAARLGISWQDACLLSLHGKEEEQWLPLLLDKVCFHEKVLFLTSGPGDLNTIKDALPGGQGLTFHYGYNLTYPEEEVGIITDQTPPCIKKGLYVGMIINPSPKKRPLVPLLKDSYFLRDQVPMTKEAVRKLSICALNLREGDVVYDIGAGSGSISLQVAALSGSLSVYAIECKEKACDLIRKNQRKLGIPNLKVIRAMAPEGLDELPVADAAFIGGSKGNLIPILKRLRSINSGMRVVIGTISLESMAEISSVIRELPVTDLDMFQVCIHPMKELGAYHLFTGNNPVYITSFTFA